MDKLEDDGVTMIASVPVKPEVKISAYKGIKIQEYAYNVEDAEIDSEMTVMPIRVLGIVHLTVVALRTTA